MVVFTFILVLLYKFHCEKIIMGWLVVAVIMIFGYQGGRYLYDWLHGVCFSLDYVTFSFVIWNFAISGLIAVFWRAPRVINQGFLVLLSSLMSYIFLTLPEWATWTILGVLVLWDIIAVLTPCGPLRMLVEIAKERGDALPALVYDTNPAAVGRGDGGGPPTQVVIKDPKTRFAEAENNDDSLGSIQENPNASIARQRAPTNRGPEPVVQGAPPVVDTTSLAPNGNPVSSPTTRTRSGAPAGRIPKIGVLGSHLKLGLGDFVFYSVLVSRSSLYGFMTTVTSFVGILTGLCMTLFLVTVYKKALPALPISISLGLAFYFATRYVVEPFVANLMPELLFH